VCVLILLCFSFCFLINILLLTATQLVIETYVVFYMRQPFRRHPGFTADKMSYINGQPFVIHCVILLLLNVISLLLLFIYLQVFMS